jgi:uncharacterized protein (TIGR03083 family)
MEPVTSFAGVFVRFGDHLAAIRRHANGLGAAAMEAGLDAPVSTCPGWAIRDLVAHVGGIHRWAAANVAKGSVSEAEQQQMFAAPPDSELFSWYADGYAALVTTLSEADPGVDCYTFLPNIASPLEFWGRRQAHETAIHRVDAEAALGMRPDFETAFAIDGLDELINGFVGRRGGRLRADPPVTIVIAPTDARATWAVRIGPEGRTISTSGRSEAEPEAELIVRGRAADLYLLLWNRAERHTVVLDGDESLLDLWKDKVRVRWR